MFDQKSVVAEIGIYLMILHLGNIFRKFAMVRRRKKDVG